MSGLHPRYRKSLGSIGVLLVIAAATPALGMARSTTLGHVRHPFRTVRVGNISLAYRSFGHGRPLVLIQGSGAAMDVWDPLMIAGLAAERRVIVFDYRGVGGSTDDPSVPMTIDLLAQDTAGLIKVLHLGRADVLGWSLGGYVAQRLVELHPKRVRRLVLLSTDPGGSNAVLAAPDILELDTRVVAGAGEHRRDPVAAVPARPARRGAGVARALLRPARLLRVSSLARTGFGSWTRRPTGRRARARGTAWREIHRSDLDPARGVGHRCSSGKRTADRGSDGERQAGDVRGRRSRAPDARADARRRRDQRVPRRLRHDWREIVNG